MLFGAATTAQIAGWQNSAASNPRRVGTASTNASLTWTASTGATTSTTQKKFGTASMRVANDNAEITSNNSTVLGVGTNDFTVEFYVWIDSLSDHNAYCDIWSHNISYGLGCRLAKQYATGGLSSGTPYYLNIFARNQADLDYWTLPYDWPTGQWNFVVIQRTSGSCAAWVNGTLLPKSNASSGYNFDTSSNGNFIGTADGGSGIGPTTGTNYVYIDEFCVSNSWRYASQTANIPVPTAAFTVDSYTTQLLHMDGSNGGTSFPNATS